LRHICEAHLTRAPHLRDYDAWLRGNRTRILIAFLDMVRGACAPLHTAHAQRAYALVSG